LFWMVGGLFTLAPIFFLFAFPPEEFVLRRLAMMAGVGLTLLVLGILPYKKGQKAYGNAVATYRAKWGKPDEKESVDE